MMKLKAHNLGNTQRARRQPGFTLVELLIVMVILGLLASLVAPQMFGKVGSSKIKVAKTQISLISTAIDTYMLDVGQLPEDLDELTRSSVTGWDGPYLKGDVPLDPWGNAYILKPHEDQFSYTIVSLGPDGKEGGEGDNADIFGPGNQNPQ